jgi:ERCC4-related helicase
VHDLDVVTLGGRISSLRDRFGALMQPYMAPLIAQGFLYERDPTMLSPFSVQLINGKLKGAPGGYKQNGKYYNTVKILGLMARAMENLIILSVTSFDKKLKDIEAEGPAPLKADPEFKRIVEETNQLRSHPHYIGHPKMEKLRSMCLNHFEATKDDTQEDGTPRETRVMVFCNHRDVVGEIVECLNATGQGLRATEFVGQAASGGTAGKSQKNQIEVSRKDSSYDRRLLADQRRHIRRFVNSRRELLILW